MTREAGPDDGLDAAHSNGRHLAVGSRTQVSLFVVGFLSAVVAWSPSGDPVAWISLIVEAGCALVLLAARMVMSLRVAVPVALLVSGLVIETLRAPNQLEALLLLRSYLAVILLLVLSISARGRWVTPLLLTGLVVGCLSTVAGVTYLWAAQPNAKTTVLNAWLQRALSEALTPAWTTRVELPNPNAAALLLATVLPLLFVGTLRWSGPRRWASLAGTLTLCAALLVTSGRASWLGATIGLVTSAVFVRKGLLALTVGILLAASIAGTASAADPRLSSFESVGERVQLWRLSLEMLGRTMPLGVGLGNFPHLLWESYRDTPPQIVPTTPHNSWLQLAGDAGLLGLAAFAIGFVMFVRGLCGIRHGSLVQQAASAALVTYGAISTFESLVVFTQPIGQNAFVMVASPIPWVLLAIAERERIARSFRRDKGEPSFAGQDSAAGAQPRRDAIG